MTFFPNKQRYIHAYIHTYTHTYIHTYIHTVLLMCPDGINEVRAMCRLYVRFVTEEMLMNSITVRLKNIRQSGFLSPLYNLFMSSLASIIPTVEENVFIINVLDDTDVSETILNVTFSVRQKVDHGGQDVFYSQQFLREKVYLQRVLLARLSNLEVSIILIGCVKLWSKVTDAFM